MDLDYASPFDLGKDEGSIGRKKTEDQMNERELAHLKVIEVNERKRYRVQWARFFKKYLTYKKPYLINGALYDNIDDDLDILDQNGKAFELTQQSSDSEGEKKAAPVKKVQRKEKKRNAVGETEPEEEPLPVPPDESKWDTVFCLPFFAKPGKHTYMIKYKDSKEKSQKAELRRK